MVTANVYDENDCFYSDFEIGEMSGKITMINHMASAMGLTSEAICELVFISPAEFNEWCDLTYSFGLPYPDGYSFEDDGAEY